MKRNDTAAHFPLFPVLIDLSQKHVFLITDGNCDDETILRILRMVRPCTPYLTVLAPSPSPVLERSAGKQQAVLMKKEYDREDLYGADVVICAAQDRALKDDVFAACRTLGIRLCILYEPQRSDFCLAGQD